MFFGITIEKLLLIGLVAALVIGPERLPRYAESLAGFTKRAREWISSARSPGSSSGHHRSSHLRAASASRPCCAHPSTSSSRGPRVS